MMKMQFEATADGNMLWGEDENVKTIATVAVPERASSDYGYLAMKRAIIDKIGSYADSISFPYDGSQEWYLNWDAVDGEPEVEVETGDGWELFEEYGILEWLDPEEFFAGPWTTYEKATGQDGEQYDVVLRTDKTELRYSTI